MRVGQHHRIGAEGNLGPDVGARRILQRDPGKHPAALDPSPQRRLRFGQVFAGIDPDRLLQVLGDRDAHALPFLHGHRHQVGQIVFTLGRKRQAWEGRPQPFGSEAIRPEIDLSQAQLLRSGGGLFNDRRDRTRRVAHDPPEPARRIGLGGEQRQHSVRPALEIHDLAQRLRPQEGHVCAGHQDQHPAPGRHLVGLKNRMAGAEALRLHHQLGLHSQELTCRRSRFGANDHRHPTAVDRLARRLNGPGQQRTPAKLMQHLRARGFHPCTESGGQDDRSNISTHRLLLDGVIHRWAGTAGRRGGGSGSPTAMGSTSGWGARIRT